LGRITCEAAAVDGGLATLVLFTHFASTDKVFRLRYTNPVTRHYSINSGTRRVGAVESSARGVLTAALIRIALAHTHRVVTFTEHLSSTSDRLALLNATLLICACAIVADVLAICCVWEPVGLNTCKVLAPHRWQTTLVLRAREVLAGDRFGRGFERPVTRHHSLGSGGTRSVASANKRIACGEPVAALIHGIHRIVTFPHTDRVVIFSLEAWSTSDRLALLDTALLICAIPIFAEVINLGFVFKPVCSRITFEAAAVNRRIATLTFLAEESLTGYVRGLGFKCPGTRHSGTTSGGTRRIAAVCVACGEFVAAFVNVTLTHTNCVLIFTQEAYSTIDRLALLDAALLACAFPICARDIVLRCI